MTEDLLAKEQEFRRLNKELEQKARDLIKEVDSVLNVETDHSCVRVAAREKQRNFSENVAFVNKDNCRVTDKRDTLLRYNFDPYLSLKSNEAQKNNVNEVSSKRENSGGNKAMINFLKAKIDMLQNELQTMQVEYKKKYESCKEFELENKRLDDLKAKLQTEIESLKDIIRKLEDANRVLQNQFQNINTENSVLKKDFEGLNKQIKLSHQQLSNYDLRLNRSLESSEKLRTALKCSHIEEKELRHQIKNLQEDKRLAIKHLEKQRSELVQAFKKQMLLIDNLKKQNACLLAQRRIQITEEDFVRLLDGKPEYL